MKSKQQNNLMDMEVEDIKRFIENSKSIIKRMKLRERMDKLKEIFGNDIN